MSPSLFGQRFFTPGSGPIVASLAAALITLAGCASVAIEDAVPSGALTTTASTEPLPPPAFPDAPAPPAPDEVAATEPVASGDASASFAAPEGVGPSAPRVTGEFPNLNVARKGETGQFSKLDLLRKKRSLQAARRDQTGFVEGPAASERDAERLRKLGQTHIADTLKQIEGE